MTDLTATQTEAVRAFVARECRLADEGRYADWETLWADDPQCLYWVPAGDGSPDAPQVAYINDNRARLQSRVKQWQTGRRWSGEPASKLARVLSDLELSRQGDLTVAKATFVLVQYREVMVLWAGTVTYGLRSTDGGWEMLMKKVELVNREAAIPTLSFIL